MIFFIWTLEVPGKVKKQELQILIRKLNFIS